VAATTVSLTARSPDLGVDLYDDSRTRRPLLDHVRRHAFIPMDDLPYGIVRCRGGFSRTSGERLARTGRPGAASWAGPVTHCHGAGPTRSSECAGATRYRNTRPCRPGALAKAMSRACLRPVGCLALSGLVNGMLDARIVGPTSSPRLVLHLPAQ
jgi:hypothetical protein